MTLSIKCVKSFTFSAKAFVRSSQPDGRKLPYAGKPGYEAKEAWMCHSSKDEPLEQGHAFGRHRATAYIENQAWQRNLDGADGFTGIATDAQALWTRVRLNAMMEGSDNEAYGAAIYIAKGVSTYLLVGRTDIGTGGATNTAQGLLEARISSHLTAPIVDEEDMHLFARSSWPGQEGRIACDVLGCGAAGEEAQLRHGLGKCAN